MLQLVQESSSYQSSVCGNNVCIFTLVLSCYKATLKFDFLFVFIIIQRNSFDDEDDEDHKNSPLTLRQVT